MVIVRRLLSWPECLYSHMSSSGYYFKQCNVFILKTESQYGVLLYDPTISWNSRHYNTNNWNLDHFY